MKSGDFTTHFYVYYFIIIILCLFHINVSIYKSKISIAEWTSVQLSRVLQHAVMLPSTRFVNFYAYDGYVDSIDMMDTCHSQTILAYGMNGSNLPVQHGAPLRIRVETQIGYKSIKYLQRIVVTDEFVDPGDSGWARYTGI